MKLTLFAAKDYDRKYFDRVREEAFPEIEIEYIDYELEPRTAAFAKGADAICAFVSANAGAETLDVLKECGVKAVLMRCAGYNNVYVKQVSIRMVCH